MSEVPVAFDREAERSVLGGMMLSPDAVWDAAENCSPVDFYEPKHATIAETIIGLANQGKPTDPISVNDELLRLGELRGVLDPSYVHELTTSTLTAANVAHWAHIVREKAVLRRLGAAGARISELASGESGGALELVEKARIEVDGIDSATKTTLKPIGSGFASFVDALAEKPRYTPSPWWDLNSLIGGFRAGGMYIVGARPAQGKSIVGLNAAMRLAEAGPVAYCSLEMSREDITARMVAQLGDVHLSPLMNHNLAEDSWRKVAAVRAEIEKTPLFVSTGDEVSTLAQVRAFARSVARRSRKGPPMAGLVVDYLQLMSSGKREESRQVEVAGFSRSLKLLAGDLGIPVIALSQLNRQTERGGRSRKPTMADLRESGAIEQDADLVLLLNHDEKNRPGDLDVIVAKNRHGKTGEVTLSWEGQFSRVRSRAWSPTRLFENEEKSA